MSKTLPLLTDADVRTCVPTDDEPGFGALRTERGCLPLEAMDVQGRIDGLLAHVTLAQTFVNTQTEPLEATYIFPLPDRAAVTHFRMEVNGRVIDGVLKERGQARQEYDQAIQAGHRAAITEEERPGTFTMRVGNLMPGEKATVRLSMVGPLDYSDGEATFRFPLVVAPRYIPGTPLAGPSVGSGTEPDTDAVPDASRISPPVLLPGFPNPVRLALSVDVASGGLPLSDLRSSLHAVTLDETAARRRISVQPGERLNRDFILRFKLGADAVKTSLVLKPDADASSQEGTYVLTVVPPIAAALAQKPRDVVFVLDRSGSMEGWKMVAARRALARMVDTLTDGDRFLVYAFDDHIESPPTFNDGLTAATNRQRFRAVEFLAKIDSRGGTEMAQPLERAVTKLQASEVGRDRILVLVTDGQVGNEDQILKNLGNRLAGIRIFTLGIDQAVNEGFLRRLAQVGGGASEIVESEDRLDAVMDRVHRRIGEPALTGLEIQAAGLRLDGDAQSPARLPDLFAGAPLFIMGRYRGAASGSIALAGRDAAGRAWSETAVAQTTSSIAVSATWARSLIRELEDRYVIGTGNRAALEKRIIDTSLRFSVLCRFTAFVAVDRSEVVNAGGRQHQVTQPVEAPAGWDMLAKCAAPVAGAAANQSMKMRKQLTRGFSAALAAPKSQVEAGAPDPVDYEMIDSCLMDAKAQAPGQAPAPDAAKAGNSDSEFELTLGDAAAASPPADGKDVFETDFDDLSGGSDGPQAIALEESDTDLECSDFDLQFEEAEEAEQQTQSAKPQECRRENGKAEDRSGFFDGYRRRAQDLLDLLAQHRADALSGRWFYLGVVAQKLQALLEDLRSVAAPAHELRPLEDLAAELNTALTASAGDTARLEAAWQQAEQTLRDYVHQPTRQQAFWK